MPMLNYVGKNYTPSGTGYMEFGSGTLRNLPFRVDDKGNVTATNIVPPAGQQVIVGPAVSGNDVLINAAFNTFSPGYGVVILAPGIYSCDAPIVVPAGCRLTSMTFDVVDNSPFGAVIQRSNVWAQGGAPQKAMIVPNGLDVVIDKINIDVTFPADTIDGIASTFNCLLMEDINMHNGPNNGVTCGGIAWRANRVNVFQAYNYGYNNIGTDSDYTDCIASACLEGWFINDAINSSLIRPRAEFNTDSGFILQGDNTATGGLTIVSPTTDRNANHGIAFSGSGYFPVNITGANLRRDGSNGTGNALNVAAATTNPLVISGLTVFPGFNDNGSGTLSPVTGVSIGAGCRYVSIVNAYVHAATTPFGGTAPNNGRAIATTTGIWNGPGAVTLVADTA